MNNETIGKVSATIFIATLLALIIIGMGGCASITKEVTGPDGYGYKETIKAFGGGNIERAARNFGGTLEVFHPDGSPMVKIIMQSKQDSEGMTSNIEALITAAEIFKTLR